MKRKDKDVSPIADTPSSPVMQTLAPKYDASRHGVYLDALQKAVDDPDNLNVALSGSYGVGKSSVLRKFSELHVDEVVDVSFSGLRSKLRAAPTEVNAAATTKTNQIQKEIVKQLLYRERPSSTPASRYRRPETFQWKREAAISALVGLSLAVVGYFTGFLDRPLAFFFDGRLLSAIFLIGATVATAGVIFGLRRLFHNRVIIEKFSAGPATIALSPQSTTFFDEYLDEIVYFFQASRRRFVVFEDLDRFNDFEIFQSLRALNTILNRSDQLSSKPVVFIYAVRDSIFESASRSIDDAAEAEVELANRTKFFDLVVPMVPFVSSRNARDIMADEIKRRGFEISPELVDLAAQHVADMRLILNLLNEYAMFDKVLVPGKSRAPSLTPDKLFALILYKSVHLRDFELIRLSRSQLDDVYDRYREFVGAAARNARQTATSLQASRVMASQRIERAADYRDAIVRAIEITCEGLGIPSSYPNKLSLDGQEITAADLAEPETWQTVANREIGLELVLGYGIINQAFSFSHVALIHITGSQLTVEEWADVDDSEVAKQHEQALSEARRAPHLTMEELFARVDLILAVDPDRGENFAEATERLLKSKLARSLVRNGFIDEYFGLYAAQYHSSRVSENAMNFIIRRVDRGLSDPIYELSEDDVVAVLRERPEVVHDKAVLNVHIVDYILKNHLDATDTIRQLTGEDPDAADFLQYFFEVAESRTVLIHQLASQWPGLLTYLAGTLQTDEATRAYLLSAATQSLNDNVDYLTDATLAAFVQNHADALPLLVEEQHANPSAGVKLLTKLGTLITDVDVLSPTMRDSVIANNAFQLTEQNLARIVGRKDVSLDSLVAHSENLYLFAISLLGRYLKLQETSSGTPYGIRSGTVLVRTLKAAAGTPLASEVIDRSLPSIRIADISTIPKELWAPVANAKLIRPSGKNALTYFAELGWDESIVAAIRSRRTLDDIDDMTAASRNELAVAILSASGMSVTLRAQIAKRLLEGTLLDPSQVPVGAGELFGLLVRRGVLPDTEETFIASKGVGWKWRESLIAASKHFAEYVTPALLTSVEVAMIARSATIGPQSNDSYSRI